MNARRTRTRRTARVLFVLYTNPAAYPPVMHAASILHEHGFDVRILGTHGQNTDGLGRPDDRIDVRLASKRGDGIVQKLRYLYFILWSLGQLATWRPSWVYASDPMATPLALLAILFRRRVVYHEHDIPAEPGSSIFMHAIAAARRAVVRGADVVVAPSRGRAESLERWREHAPITVVWNCPRRADVVPRIAEADRGVLRVAYHGTLVPARLPLAMIDALALTRHPVEVTIAGYETVGMPGYIELVRRRATGLGVDARIHFLGLLPRADALKMAAAADLGIALIPTHTLDPNESTMAGASNKVFEYLACGIPVLVADLPDWRRLFVEAGVAFTCDPSDARSIAAAFDSASEQRELLESMGERGQQLILSVWNYETSFAPVLAKLLSDNGDWDDRAAPEARVGAPELLSRLR